MQTATILHMNHEESQERDAREERYRGSQDDISIIRRELNKLTGEVGKLVTAFKGDDLGREGMVAQVRTIIEEHVKLKTRLDDIERVARLNQKYLFAFIGTLGVVLGTVAKIIIDHLFTKKP
jgi:hypothetical protein